MDSNSDPLVLKRTIQLETQFSQKYNSVKHTIQCNAQLSETHNSVEYTILSNANSLKRPIQLNAQFRLTYNSVKSDKNVFYDSPSMLTARRPSAPCHWSDRCACRHSWCSPCVGHVYGERYLKTWGRNEFKQSMEWVAIIPRSVDLSAPTILWALVWLPSMSMLFP